MTNSEQKVLAVIRENSGITMADIVTITGLKRSTTWLILCSLMQKELIRRVGNKGNTSRRFYFDARSMVTADYSPLRKKDVIQACKILSSFYRFDSLLREVRTS